MLRFFSVFKLHSDYIMMVDENQYPCTGNTLGEILKDVSKAGKDRLWSKRKLSSLELADRLKKLHFPCAENVSECSEVLEFEEKSDGTLRLVRTWFCKNKLCAICNWRKALKYSYQSSRIIDKAIQEYPKARFLFLTLTIKNMSSDKLKDDISEMSKGFNRLFKYKKVDKNIIGFVRSLEVTRNHDTEEYHPHFHVLLMVKPTYFKNSENYIPQTEWIELWKKAMKLDYDPVVNIKVVKSTESKEIDKAVKETAKYPIKPFDVDTDKDGQELSEETKLRITGEIMDGLYRKRQIGFGKLFKQIKKELELDDLEDGDLVNVSDENDDTSKGRALVACWNKDIKNYVVVF